MTDTHRRTISNDCTMDAVQLVCSSRLAGDTVPDESKGVRVDTLPVANGWYRASVEKFTVTAGLEYLPAEQTSTTTTESGRPTGGSEGTPFPSETAAGRSEAGRKGWSMLGIGVVGVIGLGVGLS